VEKEVARLIDLGIIFRTGHVIDETSWRDLEKFVLYVAHGASKDILPSFVSEECARDGLSLVWIFSDE